LLEGVRRAFHKRPIPTELIEDLVDQTERELLRKSRSELSARIVGRSVLKRLHKIDKVAWLRFASVYLAFDDLTDFEDLIEREMG
jgi:transcriptional repressor NrdR